MFEKVLFLFITLYPEIYSAQLLHVSFFLLVFMPWMQESTSKCLLKIGLNLLLKAIDSIPFHHLL